MYNLANDPSEKANLASPEPEKLRTLSDRFPELVDQSQQKVQKAAKANRK